MRKKCHICLCRSCLVACCDRKNCTEKKESCENYSGFRQLGIFDTPQEPEYHSVPRHPLAYYGLTDERVKKLETMVRSGRYTALASQAAHRANEMISEYILLSVTQNKSYDALERLWARGEIDRIPYGKTDFYGIRRYFYHLFDLEVREIK